MKLSFNPKDLAAFVVKRSPRKWSIHSATADGRTFGDHFESHLAKRFVRERSTEDKKNVQIKTHFCT